MRLAAAAVLGVAAALAGCGLFHRSDAPVTPAHYTLGGPYQLGGAWYYPREQAEYDASGLAAVTPGHGGSTADGERFDGSALAGSHRTLQVPAVVRVTNLENGRSLLLRLNDRGPANPGRLLGLTRHAAELLGVADGTQIRVQLDSGLTGALTEQVGGAPKLQLASAPIATVQSEQLAPPPGVGQSSRGRVARADAPVRDAQPAAASVAVPDRLPDQVTQGPAAPGQIVLRADEFSRADYARREAAQLAGLGASAQATRTGRTERFLVRAGPFATVAAADAALDQARRAGVIDAQLVVE